jgi:hypothetical protein
MWGENATGVAITPHIDFATETQRHREDFFDRINRINRINRILFFVP